MTDRPLMNPSTDPDANALATVRKALHEAEETNAALEAKLRQAEFDRDALARKVQGMAGCERALEQRDAQWLEQDATIRALRAKLDAAQADRDKAIKPAWLAGYRTGHHHGTVYLNRQEEAHWAEYKAGLAGEGS